MSFPSKLAYTNSSSSYSHHQSLLFISDSGNERILVIDENSFECIETIGSSIWGDENGNFQTAKFNHP